MAWTSHGVANWIIATIYNVTVLSWVPDNDRLAAMMLKMTSRKAPASLQNFWQIQTGRRSAFCFSWKPSGAVLGPSHDRPENGSFSNVLCGLIAGSQPSKFDFRSFSKLLPNQFLLQIELSGSTLWSQHLLCAPNCGAPIPPDQGGVAPRPAADLLLGLTVKSIRAIADQGRETYGLPQFETGPRQVRAPKRH